MCVVRGSAIIVVFWRGLRREFQDRVLPEHSPPLGSLEWLLSLSHAHESRRAQGAAMLVFFLPLFPLGVSRLREQFAAVSRKQYDQSVRLCRKPRYGQPAAQRKGGPAPGKPVLRRRPRDASFCDDASEYQTEDYVQARQGVGVGPGPASTRVARVDGAGAPPRDFSARIAPSESWRSILSRFLRREARRPGS